MKQKLEQFNDWLEKPGWLGIYNIVYVLATLVVLGALGILSVIFKIP